MTSPFDAGRSQAGFTLIELLIVLIIIALATALAGWQRSAANLQDRQVASQLVAALNQTRNEALRLNRHRTFDLATVRGDSRLASTPIRSTARLIRFAPDGTAHPVQIQIGKEDTRYRIEIDWLTGAVAMRAP